MTFKADLHCHSTCSDGTDSPIELLLKAKEMHLQGLSITDHDTLSAYTPEVFLKSSELEIKLLVGVELSTELQRLPVHILAYGIDLSSASFISFLNGIRENRLERNRAILKKLKEIGINIEEKDLPGETIGRPHIAKVLVERGMVASVHEAFQLYLKDGACCYVSGFRVTPLQAIQEIQKARGKAVLAHPHFYPKGNFLNELLSYSWDGIEGYYGLLPGWREKPWIDLAKKRGWIVTGGSDYHGSLKPQISLGVSWTREESFNQLFESKSPKEKEAGD